jgi:hypothetical protein
MSEPRPSRKRSGGPCVDLGEARYQRQADADVEYEQHAPVESYDQRPEAEQAEAPYATAGRERPEHHRRAAPRTLSSAASPLVQKRPHPVTVKAQHHEIAVRYARGRGPYDPLGHRLAEVSKLAMHRRRTGRQDVEFDVLIRRMQAHPNAWSRSMVAKATRLTWGERVALKIKTIPPDLPAEEFKRLRVARKQKLDRERQQRNRAKKVRVSADHRSLNDAKPWVAEGISRATWFRRKRGKQLLAELRREVEILSRR